MNLSRFRFLCLAVCLGGAGLVAMPVDGQPPAENTATIAEQLPDGTVIVRTTDGRVLRATAPKHPSAANPLAAPGAGAQFVPIHRDGQTHYVRSPYNPFGQDAESQKLIDQEQSAAQEARTLSAQAQSASSDAEKTDAKKKLRDKLAQIFDLQQNRRTREIAKIEERLGKLKDTLKKRETSKDSIVDRRVETLTGGVDELGWEETFAGPGAPYPGKGPNYGPASYPRGYDVPPPATRSADPFAIPSLEPRSALPALPDVVPRAADPAVAPVPPAPPALPGR